MKTKTIRELVDYLSTFQSPERRNKMDEVLRMRTRFITVVLENIYQPHNANAVIRTCELLGIQDVHIIEKDNKFNVSKDVSVGSAGWIDIHRYEDAENEPDSRCFENLREYGYRIVAASPDKSAKPLGNLKIDRKLAVVFGTEESGLSDFVMENSDEVVSIPMYGFTGSYNLSVACAIVLRELGEKMRNSNIDWQLTEEEALNLKYSWLRNSVKNSDLLLKRYISEHDIELP